VKDLEIGDITFGRLDKSNEIEIEIVTDRHAFSWDTVGRYINKEQAQQIMEHLKEVFEL